MKCIFCGFRTLKYDGALEELKTHSATCPQHPAVIALSEAREREGRLQALLQEIADNDEASLTELESMGFAQIVDRTLYDKIRAALTEPTRAGETQAQDEYEPPFGVARFPVRIPAAQPQGERTDTEPIRDFSAEGFADIRNAREDAERCKCRRMALSEIPGWALNDGCTEMIDHSACPIHRASQDEGVR
jgi:hypothetical protein